MTVSSLFSVSTRTLLSVERAISDIRSGFAVMVHGDKQSLLVMAADTLSELVLEQLVKATDHPPRLILSGKRAHAVFPNYSQKDIPIRLPLALPLDKKALYYLSGLDIRSKHSVPVDVPESADILEKSALELVKLAELIPAAIVIPLTNDQSDQLHRNALLRIEQNDISTFKQHNTDSLREVCKAPLCLEGAEDAAIHVYRPELGGSEHYAIIIGSALQDDSPLVRIHSSCYTGDLLRSLKCDCGDQLHEAIRFMGEKAAAAKENDTDGITGGIIIYLMQEGRGIGLTNKLRAYDLQAQGMDTVDANEVLGFDDDERLFEPAVEILKKLDISQIRLLSNNPRKATEVARLGISVTECVPHIMQPHAHNDHYLRTKAIRLGHTMPKTTFDDKK